MSYRLTAYGKTRKGLVGVKWGDLSNAEYAAACELYPGLDEQGYFEHIEDEPKASPRPRREGNIDVYDAKSEVTNG